MMDARNGSPSRFEDNKGRLEMISSRNQDANSTKKNLFVQEFQLEDVNKMTVGREYGHGANRKITLTAEDIEEGSEKKTLPSPVTPEQKLRRYLSLKLSADYHDLLTMSASSPIHDTTIQNKQTHGSKLRVFSLFSAQRLRVLAKQKNASAPRNELDHSQSKEEDIEPLCAARRDFICLPDFGEHTRAAQLRDADSLLDSLFS